MAKSRIKSSRWMWEEILVEFSHKGEAAPVSAFKHAPLSSRDVWKWISLKGTVAEVGLHVLDNRERNDKEPRPFWFVEVLQFGGYFAKVRFLGFPDSQKEEVEKRIFWVHYSELKEIGYYAQQDVESMPPFPAEFESREECVKNLFPQLVGKLSIHTVFDFVIERSAKGRRKWSMGQRVEVFDKDCCSQMRVGYVKKRKGGRFCVCYWNSVGKAQDSFWVHGDSDLIKPEGWSKAVGINISAPEHYSATLPDPQEDVVGEDPCCVDIELGMLFEMINPIRLNEIAVGKVTEVLKNGYFRCRIESPVTEEDLEVFLLGENSLHFHVTSPSIFPCGTCAKYGQPLSVPEGWGDISFKWDEYLLYSDAKALPLPEKLPDPATSQLRRGMWVEAVDSHLSEMVCPANVYATLGPYAVRVRFLGWPSDYDQWKPLDSTELYPIGWAELVDHGLSPIGIEIDNLDHVFDYEVAQNSTATLQPVVLENPAVVGSEQVKSNRGSRSPKKRVGAPKAKPSRKPPGPSKKRKTMILESDGDDSDSDHIENVRTIPSNSYSSATKRVDLSRSRVVGRKPMLVARRSVHYRAPTSVKKLENETFKESDPEEEPSTEAVRRSRRSRQATAFFGNNVDTRHIRLIP